MSGGTVSLRIDVDFAAGLERAVPWMLDRLAERGRTATFFVVAGHNDPPSLLRRLRRPGYATRLMRLGPWRVVRHLGGGGAMLADPARAAILRRIEAAGHEVAVHGHDHAWWGDTIWHAPADAVEAEVERAFRTVAAVLGSAPRGWGAPGWRTTPDAMRAALGRRAPYLADVWGDGPFIPLDDAGREIETIQLPITLPSLEGGVVASGLTAPAAARRAVAAIRPGRCEVVCVHDYFEGLLRRDVFVELLDALDAAGARTATLHDAAAAVDRATLARATVTRRPLPGFAGDVSWQAATAAARTVLVP